MISSSKLRREYKPLDAILTDESESPQVYKIVSVKVVDVNVDEPFMVCVINENEKARKDDNASFEQKLQRLFDVEGGFSVVAPLNIVVNEAPYHMPRETVVEFKEGDVIGPVILAGLAPLNSQNLVQYVVVDAMFATHLGNDNVGSGLIGDFNHTEHDVDMLLHIQKATKPFTTLHGCTFRTSVTRGGKQYNLTYEYGPESFWEDVPIGVRRHGRQVATYSFEVVYDRFDDSGLIEEDCLSSCSF